jgi:3-hydroxyacyl-[acyl-carrier-protein] dehydratase
MVMPLTPHGPGFSFLDAFDVTEPGRTGRGRKRLDPALPFFADHFPGRPLMPGVLLIECAAQAAGALWASILGDAAPHAFVLAQVMQFKLLAPVVPGETVETEVVFAAALGALAQFDVTLRAGGQEIARGRLALGRPAV